MNLNINDIIIEPVISEKSTLLASKRQYVFKVNQKANKNMIVNALERLFEVKVDSCNIINIKGKKRRTRKQTYTHTSGLKKAIVKLKEGEFDFFETIQ